ncbi:MAG TPA: hypothetical protein VM166_05040 [Gemmatimonadaceae bacterium]|nr:hypothetical protein [Gemmatimonadaceae bacterium]
MVSLDGFLGHEALEGGARYAEPSRSFPVRQSGNRSEPLWIDPPSWSTKLYTLRLCPSEASPNSFLNPCAFELSYGTEDVHLQLPGWRRCVDPFCEAHERHTKRL